MWNEFDDRLEETTIAYNTIWWRYLWMDQVKFVEDSL